MKVDFLEFLHCGFSNVIQVTEDLRNCTLFNCIVVTKTRDELIVFKSNLLCICWVFKFHRAFYTLLMFSYVSALASVRNL